MSQVACDFFDDVSLHAELLRLNEARLQPRLESVDVERQLLEERFLQRARAEIASRAGRAPSDATGFVAWFEQLEKDGPGQRDPLFAWLEHHATLEQFRWFLRQEAAGEARPDRELGFDQATEPVPEAVALGNLLAGLAFNRRYAFHAIGALGVVELTAPRRLACVSRGLERLGVDPDARQYYATSDALHFKAWNVEVLGALVTKNPICRFAIAEGALMRLAAGARCFEKYRLVLGVPR
jgi:hypothetical protein